MDALNISWGKGAIKRLVDARKTVDVLVGMIKTEYNITDYEIEKPKEMIDLESKLESLEKIVAGVSMIIRDDMTAVPKHGTELKELQELQEKLSSHIGMNELIGTTKRTFHKIQPKVMGIILGSWREVKSIEGEDKQFLNSTLKVDEYLTNKLDGRQFDIEGRELLQQYLHELLDFIERNEAKLTV
jgi:hypothetical protein